MKAKIKKQNCKRPLKLYLAPMEGLGNYPFRNAMASIGGFDEATKEFISVPKGAHTKSLAKKYDPNDCFPIPQAAQIMGSCIESLKNITLDLQERKAPRIELNLGCPSNTVTGKGSGSSLLQYPDHIHNILKAMVEVASVPITCKIRSGYLDTSLYEENLFACQESGVNHITIHPRTKLEGYKGSADIHLIKKAKELLSIPVIGNGDIKNYDDAKRMLEYTGCDGLMIGRGAVINPWVFHEIRNNNDKESIDGTIAFLEQFYANIVSYQGKNKIGQLKQLFSFLFQRKESLLEKRKTMLRSKITCPLEFYSFGKDLLLTHQYS